MRSTSCAIIGTRRNFHSHVISFGETCVECAFACVTSCLSCVIIRFVITHFIITCIAPSFRRELRTSWRTWRVRRRHPPPVQQRRWTGTAGRRRSVSCRKLASGTSTSANDAMTWRRKTPNWRVACLSVSGGGGVVLDVDEEWWCYLWETISSVFSKTWFYFRRCKNSTRFVVAESSEVRDNWYAAEKFQKISCVPSQPSSLRSEFTKGWFACYLTHEFPSRGPWASETGGQGGPIPLDFKIWYFPINVSVDKSFSPSFEFVKEISPLLSPLEKILLPPAWKKTLGRPRGVVFFYQSVCSG